MNVVHAYNGILFSHKKEWRTYSNLKLENFMLSEGVTHRFVLPNSQQAKTVRRDAEVCSKARRWENRSQIISEKPRESSYCPGASATGLCTF